MRTDEVLAFLRDELAHGPRLAEEIKAKALDAGIAPKRLRGARERLQVVTRKDRGFMSKWRWSLPGDPSVTAPEAPAPRCSTVRPNVVKVEAPRERSAVGRMWERGVGAVKAAVGGTTNAGTDNPVRRMNERLLEDVLKTFRDGERQVVSEDVLWRLGKLRGMWPGVNGRPMTPAMLDGLMFNIGIAPRWLLGFSTVVGFVRDDVEFALACVRAGTPCPRKPRVERDAAASPRPGIVMSTGIR